MLRYKSHNDTLRISITFILHPFWMNTYLDIYRILFRHIKNINNKTVSCCVPYFYNFQNYVLINVAQRRSTFNPRAKKIKKVFTQKGTQSTPIAVSIRDCAAALKGYFFYFSIIIDKFSKSYPSPN